MGGAKKKSLAQAEKQQGLQTKREQAEQRKKKPEAKAPDKKIGGINIPNLEDKGFTDELLKMRAITPYSIASKYNVRLSVAKDMIEALEAKGLIQLVAGNTNLKIYRFGSSTPA